MKRKRDHATRRVLKILPRRSRTPSDGAVIGNLAMLARSGSRGLISLVLGAVMLGLIGLLIANFVGQVMQSARLESERSALQAEVDQLRSEQSQMQAAVAYAESDVHVEQIAREQLGYARDGDTVILPQIAAPTPSPTVSAPAPTPMPTPVPTSIPNWQRWWGSFFPSS